MLTVCLHEVRIHTCERSPRGRLAQLTHARLATWSRPLGCARMRANVVARGRLARSRPLGCARMRANVVARGRLARSRPLRFTSMHACTGCILRYVTAEDVGTSESDMACVFSTTRHTTCIPALLGGSGNPSIPTARGIVCAMEAGLEHLGMGSLDGKSVAVQGLGHVGFPLITFLAERGVARIVATDIFAANVDAARAALGERVDLDVRVVERGDNSVLTAQVDVVSPNATGGVRYTAIHAPLPCPPTPSLSHITSVSVLGTARGVHVAVGAVREMPSRSRSLSFSLPRHNAGRLRTRAQQRDIPLVISKSFARFSMQRRFQQFALRSCAVRPTTNLPTTEWTIAGLLTLACCT
jgi:hypothetical protein